MVSACVFVANQVFEDILLNATTVTDALELYCINKRKIKYFFGKSYPEIYPTHQQWFILE